MKEIILGNNFYFNSHGIVTLEMRLVSKGRCVGKYPSPSRQCLIWDLNDKQESTEGNSQAYENVRGVE